MRKWYFPGMVAAILGGIWLTEKNAVLLLGILAGASLFGACFFALRHLAEAKKLCVFLLIGIVFGSSYFQIRFSGYKKVITEIDDRTAFLRGRVTEVSVTEKLRPRLLVQGELYTEGKTISGKAFYVYPAQAVYAYGDLLEIRDRCVSPQPPANFGDADYRLTLMEKEVYASFFPKENEIRLVGRDVSYSRVQDLLHIAKTKLQQRIVSHTSPESAGFLFAVLTGDKSRMYTEQRDVLRTAGLSHIMAVSGMHLQIIVGACLILYRLLRIRRRLIADLTCICAAWFFAFFVGASPSVLRAALMVTVFFCAGLLHRENDSIHALTFAALALTLINPATLFGISFQLSFAATLTILLFSGKLANILSFLPGLLRQSLSVSLSAAIGFVPLTALYFGAVSAVGVLTNLLVCPLLPFLMVCGYAGALFANIPFLSEGIFFILDMAVRYILYISAAVTKLSFSSIALPYLHTLAAIGYIALCGSLYALLYKKKKLCIYFLDLALLLFLANIGKAKLGTLYTEVTF